jgi:hypothetical protein
MEHTSLLINGACEVRRRASRLECETGPTVFDWALAVLVALGATVGLRFALDAHGSLDRLIPAVLLLMISVVGATRVRRRMAAAGRVTLDRDTRELVRGDRRWTFSDVRRIEMREDGFDASRPDLFPGNPSWLEVELADGTVLHIAKGSEDELRPVFQALEVWQFRAVMDGGCRTSP